MFLTPPSFFKKKNKPQTNKQTILNSVPLLSKKAGNVAWSKQDWTKHEFHMDELLIISSYYLVWVFALHFY